MTDIKNAIEAGGLLAKFYGFLAGLMALTVAVAVLCRYATATEVATPLDVVSRTATWLGVTDLSTLDEIGHWVQTRGEDLAAASIVVGLLALMLSSAWAYNSHSSPTDLRGTQTFWMCAAVLAQVGNWKTALSGVGIIASWVLCLFFIDVRDRRRTHSPCWPRMNAVGTLVFGVIMSALFPVFVVAHALGGKSLISTPRREPAPSRSSIPASPSPEQNSASLASQIARRAPIVLKPPRDLNPEDLFVPSDTKLTPDLKPPRDLNPEDLLVPSETKLTSEYMSKSEY